MNNNHQQPGAPGQQPPYQGQQPYQQQPYQQPYQGQPYQGQPYQQQPPYQQPYQQPPYQQPYAPQQIIINQPPVKKNGIGTAGFILALLSLVLCWTPVLGFILWLLGTIFSVIGLFKAPRGLAIAGTVISFLGIIALILFFGAVIGLSTIASM